MQVKTLFDRELAVRHRRVYKCNIQLSGGKQRERLGARAVYDLKPHIGVQLVPALEVGQQKMPSNGVSCTDTQKALTQELEAFDSLLGLTYRADGRGNHRI